jgi:hypothetical protein
VDSGTFANPPESIPPAFRSLQSERPTVRRALPLAFLFLAPAILPAQTRTPIAAAATAAPLPITRVSLYKNGVGFFEHTGRVTGSQSVTIDFTTAQLNDVLQSLTAIDLGGGRISGAGYNSTTPLDQQLKSLSLGLGADASSVDFYNAIRGSRVEVTGAGPSLTGRLLSIELRTVPTKDDATQGVEKRFLTVVSDTGSVRTFELTQAVQVRLLDTDLHQDVTRYLQLLASTRSSGLRHLTLRDNGPENSNASRELHVSYISEVPIWKSTYRILFTDQTASTKQTATLQGWSVVDNTTGSDWLNVQLSLIAGAPQSFIQPISTPYYSRRPEIPLPEEAQLAPQTHESGLEDTQAKMASRVASVAGMAARGGSAGGALGGVMGGIGPSAQTVTVSTANAAIPYETSAADSILPDTTTRAFDDFFEYKISQPITIRKNESALVPILQTKIDAERVTLWSPQQPVALRALWITNTSDLTLDRGSFAIVEDGSFGGEGLLDPIHPNERRLLSYAADQAVRVSTDNAHDTRRVQRIAIAKGVLTETTAEVAEVEYLVKNAAPAARTVIVEQPRRTGWALDSDPKPIETTPTTYRFRVETKPNETVRLHIGERHTLSQFYRLVSTSDDQLSLILKNAKASPALLAQLEPVFAAKRALSTIDGQVNARQQSITDIANDQKRLRDNLSALKSSVEERTLTKRYTDELNTQEDQLATLNKDLAALKQQRQAAQADLSTKIESLNLDEAL